MSVTARAERRYRIVILGLSITSSWGNGHATTYRSLVKALMARGHQVLFLERDMPWYAANRDLPRPPYGRTELYTGLDDLQARFTSVVQEADLAMVGSYVPDGIAVAEWLLRTAGAVRAFYDIDTPVTLASLVRGDCAYLAPALIPRFDLYLSFSGGPLLTLLEQQYGAPRARALYCAVDPDLYFPTPDAETAYDLGYMGTYSEDRQPLLDRLLLEPARCWPAGRFLVVGPQYPITIEWPHNVDRIEHLPPTEHRDFYARQRFTLNITRADMVRAGYSPSVRLFEAAACGTPIISDQWDGLETVLLPDSEILIARTAGDVLGYLHEVSPAKARLIAERARSRVLAAHTAAHRALELERSLAEVLAPH